MHVVTLLVQPVSRTGLGKLKRSATELMQEALSKSLKSAGLQMKVRLDPTGKQEKSCFSFIFFVYIILVLKRGGTDLKLKVLVAFSANFEQEI